METIQYHSITSSDYLELFKFWKSITGLVLHNDFSETKEGFDLFLKRNPNLSLVARINNKIIGAVLCSHDGRRGYLNHLAVSDKHQGLGIGTELVTKSIENLKRENIHKTMIPVLKSNYLAQQFWTKFGFTKEEDINFHSMVY